MNIEDSLQDDNSGSVHITFNPDVSTPFTIISNYIVKQTNQLEEQEKTSKSEKTSWLFSIAAGLGLDLLLDGDDECYPM